LRTLCPSDRAGNGPAIHQESAMTISCGHLRKLTDWQIREVLKWHRETLDFRRSHGTLKDLAVLLGVSPRAVRGCFENRISEGRDGHGIQASSGRGRPRHLNPAQIAFAVAWRTAGRRFHARHGSVTSLANKLGVCPSTIRDCIRRGGRYRQRAYADAVESRISRRNRPSMPDDALRSTLLRAWRRSES